jgi:predicted MFS family arabinose efflux permease
MFFFLSLFIQNVMGYSPLRAGFAFLPFSFGIVISATIVSRLVNRIDPRYIAGVGTLVASLALLGFSRLSVPDSAPDVLQALTAGENLGSGVNYWTQIFPFVVVMALGMGAVFVPLTLTAVHHVRKEDSGIGSGVLNTMQQVGGALGLAVLSTVASHYSSLHADKIGSGVATGLTDAAAAQPGFAESMIKATGAGSFEEVIGKVTYLGSFTQGATHAFVVGTFMMLTGSLVVWLFLNVSHRELAQDAAEHPEAGVHVG